MLSALRSQPESVSKAAFIWAYRPTSPALATFYPFEEDDGVAGDGNCGCPTPRMTQKYLDAEDRFTDPSRFLTSPGPRGGCLGRSVVC
jgi:hypothetical protein